LPITFANGLATAVAGGLVIGFAAGLLAVGGTFVVARWPITVADAGAFTPRFEAVPLGKRQAADDFSTAGSFAFAAVGLAISLAGGMLMVAAGWPINVADPGAFNPVFLAVPLGTRGCGMGFCTALSLPLEAAGDRLHPWSSCVWTQADQSSSPKPAPSHLSLIFLKLFHL
jgi:hypothetical protein